MINHNQNIKQSKSTKVMYWTVRVITIILLGYSIVGVFLRRSDDSQSADFLFIAINALVLFIASFVPYFLKKKFYIAVPELLLRIYIGFVTCALLIGEIGGFFVYVKWWDSALHLFSGSLVGVVGFSLINLLNDSEDIEFKLKPAFVALFVFCFSLSVEVIWEIIEYLIDGVAGSNMQRFRDSITGELWLGRHALRDTMKDLILNTIGAFIISILGYIDLKRRKGLIQKVFFWKMENNHQEGNKTE